MNCFLFLNEMLRNFCRSEIRFYGEMGILGVKKYEYTFMRLKRNNNCRVTVWEYISKNGISYNEIEIS